MKKLVLMSSLIMALSTPLFAKESTVNLIGLDENGEEINLPIKSGRWQKRMAKVFNRVGGDILPAIRKHSSNEKFKFAQFDLGLYVAMKFGIGVFEESPVSLKMGVEPYFKLHFKK